ELGVEARVLELGADALGELGGAALVGFFADDDELFAAETADRVGVALHAAEDVREALDDEVADVVAVRVVDALEVIDVADEHAERLFEPRGAAQLLRRDLG